MIKNITLVTLVAAMGCATAPKSRSGQADLIAEARETVSEMESRAPALRSTLEDAEGYAVFPEIGKGGLIVGGAHGRGVLFERGRPVGFVQLNEASIGLQAGGQSFSELIVFHDRESLDDVKMDKFEVAGNASVIALTTGAGASIQPLESGITVFVLPRGGLMADVSVGGQRIDFEPRG